MKPMHEEVQPKTVMVRVTEWTEWMPCTPSDDAPGVMMTDGVTGFLTGPEEKLLEVAVTGTGINRDIKLKSEDGSETVAHYGLYAFQAVLAQNVSEEGLKSVLEVQRPIDLDPVGGDSGLVVVQNPPMVPPNNRQQRRHPKKKK